MKSIRINKWQPSIIGHTCLLALRVLTLALLLVAPFKGSHGQKVKKTRAAISTLKESLHSPSNLRIDLLQHPDRVYKSGHLTKRTLDQLRPVNDDGNPYQYASVNSRFPGFTWTLDTLTRQQIAFQIQVAHRPEDLKNDRPDVWNSGKLTSTQSVNVPYSGPPLQPLTTYYWRVKTWSQQAISKYSAIQAFRTGDKLSDYGLPGFVLTKTMQAPVDTTSFGINYTQYDFGKDGFGQVTIQLKAMQADTVRIRLGEALNPEGHIDSSPPGTVRYREIFLPLKKGTHEYELPIVSDKRNTGPNAIKMPAYIGEVLPFRFLEITGDLTKNKILDLRREMVHIPFNDSATVFESSDNHLNKVWGLCKYTMKATSFTGYYVDGDRERIPYEADALINQLSHYSADASFNMAKRTLQYLIYHPTWPAEWSLQNPLIAYNDYLHSGDARNLRVIYQDLKQKALTALEEENGLISTRTGKQLPAFLQSIHYHSFDGNEGLKDIVDWPHTQKETDGFVFTDYNAVVNAFYYAALRSMADIALALKKSGDAAAYTQKADAVKIAFIKHFTNPATGLVTDGIGTDHSSLHANMFAMAFGLIPDAHLQTVLQFIKTRGLSCSVYGAQFLLDALGKVDHSGYALQLLTGTGKRSWINMLQEGATMTMEAWGQQFKPNQDWNHAWGSAPANYIVRYLMGIQPARPAFEKIRIKPHPGNLRQAKIKYSTVRGVVALSFQQQKDSFHLRVKIPGNTTAQVCLPFLQKDNVILKMDGAILNARNYNYDKGYYILPEVSSGSHVFEAMVTQ